MKAKGASTKLAAPRVCARPLSTGEICSRPIDPVRPGLGLCRWHGDEEMVEAFRSKRRRASRKPERAEPQPARRRRPNGHPLPIVTFTCDPGVLADLRRCAATGAERGSLSALIRAAIAGGLDDVMARCGVEREGGA